MNSIKSLFVLFLSFGFLANATAQEEYAAKNDGWSVSLEEAYEEAKETKKPIMANFTGSDWCGWCKRLDKSVFHQPQFLDWAKENVVLLELDFPRRFRVPEEVAVQNENVKNVFASKGLVRGFPSILVFDINKTTDVYDFSLLGATGYTKTFEEFSKNVEDMIALRGTISEDYNFAYDPANPPASTQRKRRNASKPKKQEPAQNAKGVWHYTCPSGCKGGAGKETKCSSCDSMLKHNQAYHNK